MPLSISVGFKKHKDDRMVSFATTIYERMLADAKYLALKPAYDDVKAAVTAYSIAIANALNGGKDRLADRDDAKDVLVNQLSNLARKVEDACGDNARFITDAGFEVRTTVRGPKERTAKESVTELATPVLKVTNDNRKNFAKLNWSEVPHTLTYAIRMKKKEETPWQNGNYNDANQFIFDNLDSETVYDFTICAIGSNNVKSEWSPVASVWVM